MTQIKKHIRFIVNPISGTKSKSLIAKNIEKLLDTEKFTYEITQTLYPGHASALTKEAAEHGTDIVVAVGGDGTINEVARALTHTTSALGIIPCGSGNGLARHLQIPMDAPKAISIINNCNIQTLDYGLINHIPFFCTCGVGFDAFVSMKFAEAGKRGLATYLENTLREGLRYKPETYIIEDEKGTFKYEAFLITCANASQYGNNAYIAPRASMSDGLMDITIIEPFNAIEAPQIAIQLFSKTLDQNSHIKMFQAKKIKIRRQQKGAIHCEGAIHCDGDPMITGKDLEVEIVPKGIQIITNIDCKPRNENLIQIFSDYFNDISWMNGDFVNRSNRFMSINRVLLRKLRKNKL